MSVIGSIAMFVLGAIIYLFTGLEILGLGLMVIGALATALSGFLLVLSSRRGRRPPAQPL